MKKITLLFLFYLSIHSLCTAQYNQKWIDFFKDKDIVLKDSMIIVSSNDTLIIPSPFKAQKTYKFQSELSNSILVINRLNYTDISYNISIDGKTIKGIASLGPHIYLGAESETYADDEYWVIDYYTDTKSEFNIYNFRVLEESLLGKIISQVVIIQKHPNIKSDNFIEDKTVFLLVNEN